MMMNMMKVVLSVFREFIFDAIYLSFLKAPFPFTLNFNTLNRLQILIYYLSTYGYQTAFVYNLDLPGC